MTTHTAAYQRMAFAALHWVGWTFEAAMADPTRREITEFIATRWPKRNMETIVPISKIERLARLAATQHGSVREANPYPEHSAAGGLFARCFAAEKNKHTSPATRAQAAIETVATHAGETV